MDRGLDDGPVHSGAIQMPFDPQQMFRHVIDLHHDQLDNTMVLITSSEHFLPLKQITNN